MGLDDLERKRVENAVSKFLAKRRPPPEVRAKLDLGYRISGQSVEIFEVRPRWNQPDEYSEHSFAKATFVRASNHWRVYWQRADLKWHRYPPTPEVHSLDEFLDVVDRDEHGCFFG